MSLLVSRTFVHSSFVYTKEINPLYLLAAWRQAPYTGAVSRFAVINVLRDTQYFASLIDVMGLDPKDGRITPVATGDGLHGCHVDPGLS
jgi:hypothetical protein